MRAIICKHCPASTGSSADVARAAGWRMFKGESITGKPIDDVVCPACAGTAEPPPREWQVRCTTCDWDSDDGEEPIRSGREAMDVARYHECESWIEVQRPGGEWLALAAYNRDGELRDSRRGAA